jgi:hypothetical protein
LTCLFFRVGGWPHFRSRFSLLIPASLRPRTANQRVSRVPCHLPPVPRPRAHPTSISHPCNSTSRRASEQFPPPRAPANVKRKTSQKRASPKKTMWSIWPQNRAPKWELSLASYENTALSERQSWTIFGAISPPLSLSLFYRRRASRILPPHPRHESAARCDKLRRDFLRRRILLLVCFTAQAF